MNLLKTPELKPNIQANQFLKRLLTNYLDNCQKPESDPFFCFFLTQKDIWCVLPVCIGCLLDAVGIFRNSILYNYIAER